MSQGLRHTIFYRALHRSNLIMGGDRELVLTTTVVCAGLIFTALNVLTTLVAGLVFMASIKLLRMMAKSDPNLKTVYLRQLKYAKYYPARSSAFRLE